MTIKDCIDMVDNLKPNQYTITDKVSWLSFIEEIIINDVLKTHEGYDGRYDTFTGYTDDKLSVTLIVPSPYDRLYTEYLKMMIDKENGEMTRYNNSAASFNTYMSEYRKHYNKTHMPLSMFERAKNRPVVRQSTGLTDAEYDNLLKDMTYILKEYFSDSVSHDKLYDVAQEFAQNNLDVLKGKDGYTPQKGVDYFTDNDIKGFQATVDKRLNERLSEKADKKYVEDALKSITELLPKHTRAYVNLSGGYHNWIAEPVTDSSGNVIGLRYGQIVNVNNATITKYSKVDLQITSEQMVIFHEKDLAFVAENDNGVITIYCIGSIPQNDYTIQAVVTEVNVNA